MPLAYRLGLFAWKAFLDFVVKGTGAGPWHDVGVATLSFDSVCFLLVCFWEFLFDQRYWVDLSAWNCLGVTLFFTANGIRDFFFFLGGHTAVCDNGCFKPLFFYGKAVNVKKVSVF